MRRSLALLIVTLATSVASAQDAPWKKVRPDAPEEPKAAPYACEHPKAPEGWTPPTLEELEKMPGWETFATVDLIEKGRERAAGMKPEMTIEQALALKNDSTEANKKIRAAMARYPQSDDEVDWDATFNRHSASPNTLNALLQSSFYESWMNTYHAFSLLNADWEMKPCPDPEQVKSWKRLPTIDLVEIHDDLTWEDGTPITAYDIEFSYHVIMDPRVPVPAQRSTCEDLKWVKAYSPTKVAFFHKEPLATNVWNTNFGVIPKHIYEKSLTDDPTMKSSAWHAYWNRNPLSGYTYKLVKWEPSVEVVFERRTDVPLSKDGKRIRHRPYFKNVRFKIIENADAALLAFKNGELDEMQLTARQWEKQTGDDDFAKAGTKVRGQEWTYSQIIWNLKRPFFADKNVRQALALTLDHDELLKKVYFDLYPPCTGPFNPASPWGTPEAKPMKQDLDKAEKLLDAAGWKIGSSGLREKDGVKFSFTLLVPLGGTGDKVAEVFKQNLKDVGIELNVKMLEWATYLQSVQDHNFDAGVSAWGTGADPDSSKNVWTTEAAKSGRNYGGYSNTEVDDLFKKGARELDFAKRREIYQKINRLIYDDQPYLFVLYRSSFWAFSKNVRGYNESPRGFLSTYPGPMSVWKPKKAS